MSKPSSPTAPAWPPQAKGVLSRGPLASIGWAIYLGISWTWVIGMILPTLLLRDMGTLGWWAFIIPNVIGSAIVGLVLRKPEQAQSILRNHSRSIALFSAITLGFHAYVLSWFFPMLFGMPTLIIGLCVMGVTLLTWRNNNRKLGLSMPIVALIASSVILGFMCKQDGAFSAYRTPEVAQLPAISGWLFLPASIGGFMLCPYLDATYLRARASTTDRTGTWAFLLGFGCVFALMMVVSLAYAHLIPDFMRGVFNNSPSLSVVWFFPLMIHMVLQAGTTMGLHSHEIRSISDNDKDSPSMRLALWTIVIGLLMGTIARRMDTLGNSTLTEAASIALWTTHQGRELLAGELGYRLWLLPYGTLFPAIVMLSMIPLGKTISPKLRLCITATTYTAAVICGGLGLIHDWAPAYLLGLVVVGIGRIALMIAPSQSAS